MQTIEPAVVKQLLDKYGLTEQELKKSYDEFHKNSPHIEIDSNMQTKQLLDKYGLTEQELKKSYDKFHNRSPRS